MFPFAHCYVRRPKKVSDCLTKKVKMESLKVYVTSK